MGAAGAKGGAWQRYGTFGTEILNILQISACSCHAAPRPTTPPTTPGDPIHLTLDPKRPGERVSGLSLAVGAPRRPPGSIPADKLCLAPTKKTHPVLHGC